MVRLVIGTGTRRLLEAELVDIVVKQVFKIGRKIYKFVRSIYTVIGVMSVLWQR